MVQILLTLLISVAAYAGDFELQGLGFDESDSQIRSTLKFGTEFTETIPTVEFINETIQLDLPQAKVKDGKILQRVDGDKIKSLLAYQLDDETVRFRVILNKGQKAEDFKERVSLEAASDGLRLTISKPKKAIVAKTEVATQSAFKPRELSSVDQSLTDTPSDKIDESKIEAELMTLSQSGSTKTPEASPKLSETATSSTEKTAAAVPVVAASEAETPAFSKAVVKREKPASLNPWRVVAAFAIIAAMVGGLWVYVSRWAHKRNLKNPHTHIRVLTQHYLGPKKSLAIISVAGESILIGITDHNISLIKSLSLLDEEIPQQVPSSFTESLSSAENSDESNVEEYAVKGIRDVVSDRVRGMRNLW